MFDPNQLFDNQLLNKIGGTPLVPLDKLFTSDVKVFAKLEEFNLGGSVKARTAISLLRDAYNKGFISDSTTIVESSSGNLGIALATICGIIGLKFICIVDALTNLETIELIKSLGSEVIVIHEKDEGTQSLLETRLKRVKELLKSIPGTYWPNQYECVANPIAHHTTMKEILDGLSNSPDFFFCAMSTCGTMRGCSEVIRKISPTTKIVGVDAAGSQIAGKSSEYRLLPGYGAGLQPPFFRRELADIYIKVRDVDAIRGCHVLRESEGLFVGASSGAIVAGITAMTKMHKLTGTITTLFPDGGERYCKTVYNNSWIEQKFGSEALSEIQSPMTDFSPSITFS